MPVKLYNHYIPNYTYNAAAQSAQKTYTNLLTIGKKYRVTFDFVIDGITTASFTLSNGSTQVRNKITTITTKEVTEFTATATNLTLLATLSAGNYGRLAHIDNLVIEEIFETGEGYRFGFNGQEKDDEVAGNGNSLEFGERIYNARISRFLSIDKLTGSYPYWSPYAFAGNTPIQAIDLDGLEIYYSQDGNKIGTYGTSTEIRVINEDQLATVIEQFAAYSKALKTDPKATNDYLGSTLVTTGSVAYNNYFTSIKDVVGVDDKDFQFRYYKDFENLGGCFGAAKQQLKDEGVTPSGADNAIQVKVNNASQEFYGKPNLKSDPIGASIYIQTQLKKGNPVMVGVEVNYPNNEIGAPGVNYRNNNTLTSHFVVINSSTNSNGSISFGYIDNATPNKQKGTSPGNSFKLNTSNGGMSDNSNVISGSGSNPPSNSYKVTEVRKNN